MIMLRFAVWILMVTRGASGASAPWGISKLCKSFRNSLFQRERSLDELRSGIAKFYDETTGIWLEVWGEHLHHGYYTSNVKDHQQAQIEMIDKAIEWSYRASTPNPQNVVDIGCGVGGSSRHLARKLALKSGFGISLSPFQIERAKQYTIDQGLSDKLAYGVADALNMPFSNNTFDLVWSMESGEHMPDKDKFVEEMVRVCSPGGRLIIVTWCHRELQPGESTLKPEEQHLLNKINDAYYLPPWCPGSKYVDLANKLGLEDVRIDDWSTHVAPFWPAVMRSALVPRNFIALIRRGPTAIKAAIASWWMLRGFQKGAVRFVIITARKPLLNTKKSSWF